MFCRCYYWCFLCVFNYFYTFITLRIACFWVSLFLYNITQRSIHSFIYLNLKTLDLFNWRQNNFFNTLLYSYDINAIFFIISLSTHYLDTCFSVYRAGTSTFMEFERNNSFFFVFGVAKISLLKNMANQQIINCTLNNQLMMVLPFFVNKSPFDWNPNG